MAFSKTNWTELTAITAARLNNMELQLEEAKAYTDAHASLASPHSGHATVTQLNNHINSKLSIIKTFKTCDLRIMNMYETNNSGLHVYFNVK